MWLKQQFLPLQKPLQNRILYRSSPKILIGRMLEYKEFKVNLEVNSLSLKRQKLKKKKKSPAGKQNQAWLTGENNRL